MLQKNLAIFSCGLFIILLGGFYLFETLKFAVVQQIKEQYVIKDSMPTQSQRPLKEVVKSNLRDGENNDAFLWTVDGKSRFEELAKELESGNIGSTTDKVTTHSYQTMYGKFIFPMLWKARETGLPVKFLEIGLGCDMGYGPGKSVKVWQKFWGSNADIWFGEYDASCVDSEKKAGRLDGIKVVTGDQSDTGTLEKWLKETGGGFNVIIDDGGHKNIQIQNSFQVLFDKALSPGGLYFIEDLHVGRLNPYYDTMANKIPTIEIIKDWIDQLSIDGQQQSIPSMIKFKIPLQVDWIFCQREACVISKCNTGDNRCLRKN